MAQFISPQRKQEIIVSLELIIQESVEKISLYSDIYTYVDDMEPTHIPDSEVLPLKGDILREVYFKRDKMEKKIKNKDDCYAWLRTCLQLQTVMKKVMTTFADIIKCPERRSCNCTRSPKTRQNDSETTTIATNLGVSEIIKVVLSNCKILIITYDYIINC
jgi:hypothetical protein